jgi:hypothetical protein
MGRTADVVSGACSAQPVNSKAVSSAKVIAIELLIIVLLTESLVSQKIFVLL